MLKKFLPAILVFILSLSCSKRTTDPSAPPEEKHSSELTNTDIFNLALASENGGGMEFQGELLGNEAADNLSIYANGNCGKDDCGISLIMENKNHEKSISAVIKAKFRLPGNAIDEIVRMYQLLPGQAVSIGCSHICHQDNSYMIQREIISATYLNPEVEQEATDSNSPS